MPQLNYHHLRYFRAIAHERSLTRAAQRLHISQSALSIQLKKLEDSLGHPLFERTNRSLRLTEAGRIVLDHADAIFRTGEELVATLSGGTSTGRRLLRIGAMATLSRNFQRRLLRPFLHAGDVEVVVRSGSLRELLAQLQAHTLDVVLANLPIAPDAGSDLRSLLLDEQPVCLVGRPRRGRRAFRFPEDLAGLPLVLPTAPSGTRTAFDALLETAGIRPEIQAEVDDMAMLRLLARETPGAALVPRVVVQDELRSGELVEYCAVEGVVESFYAITLKRRFPNPLVRQLLTRKSPG